MKEWIQQNSSRQVKEFLHEDAHEITLGNTFIGTKEEVENKYQIKL